MTDADPRKSSMLRCCQGGKPGWNLNTALPDEAIEYIITRTATNPKRPWFIHYAQGATHAPHHPTKERVDKNQRDALVCSREACSGGSPKPLSCWVLLAGCTVVVRAPPRVAGSAGWT